MYSGTSLREGCSRIEERGHRTLDHISHLDDSLTLCPMQRPECERPEAVGRDVQPHGGSDEDQMRGDDTGTGLPAGTMIEHKQTEERKKSIIEENGKTAIS